MKRCLQILTVVSMIFACTAKSEKPWIGTYALEITTENKEMFEMFPEMDMVWPEITLNEDGTFLILKTEGNSKIKGTYEIKSVTLTIHAKDVDGKPPESKYAKPHTAQFKDDFAVLMLEGPDKERWVRKEVNEAFLKEKE